MEWDCTLIGDSLTTLILGGGVAGLSLAHFLKDKSVILEREDRIGGLSRSFNFNGIFYDVGPHIMFSKNKEILNFHTSIVKTNKIRRSNKIYHKGKLVKYPFENDLASLDADERDYGLHEFLNNPYENYEPKNMLQFFLKTFGEGITRLYLQPYNEKIWKYDPAFMDLQMVERIPKPPKEDVIKSAKGIPTEGYTHQLYFDYPSSGGFESLPKAYAKLIEGKAEINTSIEIKKIMKNEMFEVETNKGLFKAEQLVNCMPLHELFKYIEAPIEILEALKNLKYNSMYTVIVQAKKDSVGDNFCINLADKDIIFHRMSKLNFLGESYCLPNGGSTFLVEVTYRPGSYLSSLNREEVEKRVLHDLDKLGFVKREDVTATDFRNTKYTYVIYDLDHRNNADTVLNYLKGIGIRCTGRFAEFEYLNSDAIAEHSQKLAVELNEK